MTSSPATERALLPCPFCGGEAAWCERSEKWLSMTAMVYYSPLCRGCGMRGNESDSQEWAATQWNRRPPVSPSRGELDDGLPVGAGLLPSAIAPRPATSNADEWQLWLEEHAASGSAYLAVQIVEAIEEHQRALAREVYGLAENAAERFSDLASESTPEGHYSRGAISEAKSIARAVCAIMPYSRDPTALTGKTAANEPEASARTSPDAIRSEALEEAARVVENWSLPTIQTASMWLVDKHGIAADIRALKEGK